MEKLNEVEQKASKICIKNLCLREFLLKNYGESVQTVKGIKKVKHLMISAEGPEAEIDDMKRAGFSEERIAKTFSQWVGFPVDISPDAWYHHWQIKVLPTRKGGVFRDEPMCHADVHDVRV